MVDLNRDGPAMDLTRTQQNALFDVHEEFNLVAEVRDISDELNIIDHIYDEELSILNSLFSMQYHDALFRFGRADADGNLLHPESDHHDDDSE